jgi:arginase family enzyme
MPLAAACGLWDAGYGAGLDPRRVVMSDARDLDAAERELLDAAGVRRFAPEAVADAVRGERVFLHLDLDILDPGVMAAAVPAPGGLTVDALAALLRDLAAATTVTGLEVTAFDDPEPVPLVPALAAAIRPVLDALDPGPAID